MLPSAPQDELNRNYNYRSNTKTNGFVSSVKSHTKDVLCSRSTSLSSGLDVGMEVKCENIGDHRSSIHMYNARAHSLVASRSSQDSKDAKQNEPTALSSDTYDMPLSSNDTASNHNIRNSSVMNSHDRVISNTSSYYTPTRPQIHDITDSRYSSPRTSLRCFESVAFVKQDGTVDCPECEKSYSVDDVMKFKRHVFSCRQVYGVDPLKPLHLLRCHSKSSERADSKNNMTGRTQRLPNIYNTNGSELSSITRPIGPLLHHIDIFKDIPILPKKNTSTTHSNSLKQLASPTYGNSNHNQRTFPICPIEALYGDASQHKKLKKNHKTNISNITSENKNYSPSLASVISGKTSYKRNDAIAAVPESDIIITKALHSVLNRPRTDRSITLSIPGVTISHFQVIKIANVIAPLDDKDIIPIVHIRMEKSRFLGKSTASDFFRAVLKNHYIETIVTDTSDDSNECRSASKKRNDEHKVIIGSSYTDSDRDLSFKDEQEEDDDREKKLLYEKEAQQSKDRLVMLLSNTKYSYKQIMAHLQKNIESRKKRIVKENFLGDVERYHNISLEFQNRGNQIVTTVQSFINYIKNEEENERLRIYDCLEEAKECERQRIRHGKILLYNDHERREFKLWELKVRAKIITAAMRDSILGLCEKEEKVIRRMVPIKSETDARHRLKLEERENFRRYLVIISTQESFHDIQRQREESTFLFNLFSIINEADNTISILKFQEQQHLKVSIWKVNRRIALEAIVRREGKFRDTLIREAENYVIRAKENFVRLLEVKALRGAAQQQYLEDFEKARRNELEIGVLGYLVVVQGRFLCETSVLQCREKCIARELKRKEILSRLPSVSVDSTSRKNRIVMFVAPTKGHPMSDAVQIFGDDALVSCKMPPGYQEELQIIDYHCRQAAKEEYTAMVDCINYYFKWLLIEIDAEKKTLEPVLDTLDIQIVLTIHRYTPVKSSCSSSLIAVEMNPSSLRQMLLSNATSPNCHRKSALDKLESRYYTDPLVEDAVRSILTYRAAWNDKIPSTSIVSQKETIYRASIKVNMVNDGTSILDQYHQILSAVAECGLNEAEVAVEVLIDGNTPQIKVDEIQKAPSSNSNSNIHDNQRPFSDVTVATDDDLEKNSLSNSDTRTTSDKDSMDDTVLQQKPRFMFDTLPFGRSSLSVVLTGKEPERRISKSCKIDFSENIKHYSRKASNAETSTASDHETDCDGEKRVYLSNEELTTCRRSSNISSFSAVSRKQSSRVVFDGKSKSCEEYNEINESELHHFRRFPVDPGVISQVIRAICYRCNTLEAVVEGDENFEFTPIVRRFDYHVSLDILTSECYLDRVASLKKRNIASDGSTGPMVMIPHPPVSEGSQSSFGEAKYSQVQPDANMKSETIETSGSVFVGVVPSFFELEETFGKEPLLLVEGDMNAIPIITGITRISSPWHLIPHPTNGFEFVERREVILAGNLPLNDSRQSLLSLDSVKYMSEKPTLTPVEFEPLYSDDDSTYTVVDDTIEGEFGGLVGGSLSFTVTGEGASRADILSLSDEKMREVRYECIQDSVRGISNIYVKGCLFGSVIYPDVVQVTSAIKPESTKPNHIPHFTIHINPSYPSRRLSRSISMILKRVRFHNYASGPHEGNRMLRIKATATSGAVSEAIVRFHVEVIDQDTELKLPFPTVIFREPYHSQVRHVMESESQILVPVFVDCLVVDEDTDRVAGGFIQLNLENSVKGESIALCPNTHLHCFQAEALEAPNALSMDDDKHIIFEGRVVATLEEGYVLTRREPVLSEYTEFGVLSIRLSLVSEECSILSIQAILRAIVFVNENPNSIKPNTERNVTVHIHIDNYTGQQPCDINDSVCIRGGSHTVQLMDKGSSFDFKAGSNPCKLGYFDLFNDRMKPIASFSGGWILATVVESFDSDVISLKQDKNEYTFLEPGDSWAKMFVSDQISDVFTQVLRNSRKHSLTGMSTYPVSNTTTVTSGARAFLIKFSGMVSPMAIIIFIKNGVFIQFNNSTKKDTVLRKHALLILRNLTYYHHCQLPEYIHKTVRVLVSDSPNSTPSMCFINVNLEDTDDVTEIRCSNTELTMVQSLENNFPILPFGRSIIFDTDTEFFDEGMLTVQCVAGSSQGDSFSMVPHHLQRHWGSVFPEPEPEPEDENGKSQEPESDKGKSVDPESKNPDGKFDQIIENSSHASEAAMVELHSGCTSFVEDHNILRECSDNSGEVSITSPSPSRLVISQRSASHVTEENERVPEQVTDVVDEMVVCDKQPKPTRLQRSLPPLDEYTPQNQYLDLSVSEDQRTFLLNGEAVANVEYISRRGGVSEVRITFLGQSVANLPPADQRRDSFVRRIISKDLVTCIMNSICMGNKCGTLKDRNRTLLVKIHDPMNPVDGKKLLKVTIRKSLIAFSSADSFEGSVVSKLYINAMVGSSVLIGSRIVINMDRLSSLKDICGTPSVRVVVAGAQKTKVKLDLDLEKVGLNHNTTTGMVTSNETVNCFHLSLVSPHEILLKFISSDGSCDRDKLQEVLRSLLVTVEEVLEVQKDHVTRIKSEEDIKSSHHSKSSSFMGEAPMDWDLFSNGGANQRVNSGVSSSVMSNSRSSKSSRTKPKVKVLDVVENNPQFTIVVYWIVHDGNNESIISTRLVPKLECQ